MMIHQT